MHTDAPVTIPITTIGVSILLEKPRRHAPSSTAFLDWQTCRGRRGVATRPTDSGAAAAVRLDGAKLVLPPPARSLSLAGAAACSAHALKHVSKAIVLLVSPRAAAAAAAAGSTHAEIDNGQW
jgi:hypothetical protein